MKIGQHPEYQQMVTGMKHGHLSATEEDIKQVTEDRFTPSPAATGNQHPEYQEYCELAKRTGHCCC